MDTQYCLQCEHSQTKYDQYGSKYCYCFFNPDKGRWVAEIKECPNKEYIRKDALLEWVKGKLEDLKVLLDADPYKEVYVG